MQLVTINKKSYEVPDKWNELTGGQLLEIMDTLFIKKYVESQIIMKLLKILTNMNNWRFYSQAVTELDEYLYLVSFIFGENTLTKQLLPSYEYYYHGEKLRFFGPTDNGNNMTMDEFVFAENNFLQWQQDKENTALLNSFVSILYRPSKDDYDFLKNPDGDCRIPFNENLSEYWANCFINRWPLKVKLAIATWYDGWREYTMSCNPELFSGGGAQAEYGLLAVMYNVAKDGVHGNFSQVEKQYVNLIMITLNISAKEAKRAKEKMKA